MIWERSFYGYAVHVCVRGGKVRSTVCLGWDNGIRGPHFHVGPQSEPCGREKLIRCDYISLLLTCKKMYISRLICSRPSANHLVSYFECLHPLYRKTFFDFSHSPPTLPLMPKRLPATHLALISQVNLKWEIFAPLMLDSRKLNKEEILWVGMWKALAAMEGLEWLSVELRIVAAAWEAEEWTKREWTLWEGVKAVTRSSHFELILPFPAAASTREETLPCTVIRSEWIGWYN